MLIPALHFEGNCADAIALYENAFETKAGAYDYSADNKIRHAEMTIHGQMVYLNDGRAFLRDAFDVDCVAQLVLTFNTSEELLTCYDNLKKTIKAPFRSQKRLLAS